MAKYIVGDIQGCFDSLQALLEKVKFNPEKDTLYCVGDLVNRGPKSLKTIRFLKNLGSSCQVVLGNHDLHLISIFYGVRNPSKKDTIGKLLNCADAKMLIEWLRQQPLIIYDQDDQFVISHAGIYPQWDLQTAQTQANAFSKALQSDDFKNVLKKIYGNEPKLFNKNLDDFAKLRFTINAFTRMRFCNRQGALNFTEKGAPDLLSFSKKQKSDKLAWFQLPHKRPRDITFLFGHWSSLGKYQQDNVICLDSGCVWGNKLTLYDFDKKKFVSVKSKET